MAPLDPVPQNSRALRVRFGIFELDARSGELRRDGVNVRLPPQPFKVLWLLATRPGEVVTREEIRQELWGNDTFVDFDGGLNFCINQIRKALRDSAESPRFVHTLPRRGYRFIAPVEWLEDGGPDRPAPAAHAEANGPARVYDMAAARREVPLSDDALGVEETTPEVTPPVPAPVARGRGGSRAVALLAVALAAGVVALVFVSLRRGADDVRYDRVTFRRGIVTEARFAPDGDVFYSAAWSGSPPEVFAVRAGAAEARSLGLGKAALVSVLDSGELAIMRYRDQAPPVLARAPAAGSTARDVREGVIEADWLSNDLWAVIVSRGGQMHLEFPAGHDVYHVPAKLTHPRISPDGQRLAMLEHPTPGDDRGRVVVIDREGRRTQVSTEWASVEGLAWSASGREVWFTGARVGANSTLNAVTLSGRERVVTRGPGRLVLHDVGRDGRVLLSRHDRRLEVRGQLPGGAADRDLSWLDHSFVTGILPDGSAVVISESGEGGGPGYSVFLRRTDGSPAVRLGGGRALGPSPDGAWVLSVPVSGPPRIVAIPAGPGETRVLGAGLIGHAWATFFPDSRRVLFAAMSAAGRGLRAYVQEVGSDKAHAITPEGVAPRMGTVSPDGRWALVRGAGLEGRWLEYPVEGGAPREVAGVAADEWPMAWSPDGRWLYILRTRPVRIDRLDRLSGERDTWREILPSDTAGSWKLQSIFITPDGRHHVYSLDRGFSELFLVQGLR